MGNAVSGAVKAAQQQALDNEKQVVADLNNLNEVLKAKAEEYFVKLVNNKGEDKTIPIKTLIEYKKHVSASVASGPSQKLNDAIEELFGGNFMASLKAMALGAIDAVLGNTSAGSKEETGYKVLLLNNTIVRVDYYVYGFNMHTQGGTIDRTRNGLAFVATIGVVDMKQVGLEALVYLVGAQANAARVFINQRFEDWQGRVKAIDAFRTTLKAAKTVKELDDRKDNIALETVQMYLEEADAELTTTASDGTTTEVTFDPQLEDARVAAMGDYLKGKRLFDLAAAKQALPDGTDPTTVPTAEGLKTLYQKAWEAVAARAVPQVNKMASAHKDLLRSMTREQEAIMEDMKSVYLKARSITAAIQGVTA